MCQDESPSVLHGMHDATLASDRPSTLYTALFSFVPPDRRPQYPQVLHHRHLSMHQSCALIRRRMKLTLSRSAPASIRTTAASPCPLSKARCNGVLPFPSAIPQLSRRRKADRHDPPHSIVSSDDLQVDLEEFARRHENR